MQDRPQEPVQPALPPPGNGNGKPNPDQDLLDQLTLDSFTATPSSILVCTSEPVTLAWHVTEPADPRARLIRYTLESSAGGFPIGPVGSQSAQISGPTTFSLLARLGRASNNLGSVSITAVPNPASRTITLTPDTINTYSSPDISGDIGPKAGSQTRLKSAPEPPTIDEGGIHMALHFAVPTDVHIDIDVNVSLTVVPVINNGQLVLTYTNFSVDADFPWWVNVFAPGVTTIVEQVIDSIITGKIKGQLPDVLAKAAMKAMSLLQGETIAQLQLKPGQIVIITCPQ
jgi:hypothetical protein